MSALTDIPMGLLMTFDEFCVQAQLEPEQRTALTAVAPTGTKPLRSWVSLLAQVLGNRYPRQPLLPAEDPALARIADMRWRKEWDAHSIYYVNDVVTFDRQSFVALKDASGKQPDLFTDHWENLSWKNADLMDAQDALVKANQILEALSPIVVITVEPKYVTLQNPPGNRFSLGTYTTSNGYTLNILEITV